MMLPVESTVNQFIPGNHFQDTTWDLAKYISLLPQTWKDFFPAQEAFYAGQAGRTQIIAHGTTIDPNYYRGKLFFPETPSLGCLCAAERWSGIDGSRLESDQQELIDAMKMAGDGKGYAVVIDLGNQKYPVQLKEILPAIKNAEAFNQSL